jgi:hypothetical protein
MFVWSVYGLPISYAVCMQRPYICKRRNIRSLKHFYLVCQRSLYNFPRKSCGALISSPFTKERGKGTRKNYET